MIATRIGLDVGQILVLSIPSDQLMASSPEDRVEHEDEIRLWPEEGWWIAKDVETGVTTQGQSRNTALANLDEALAGYHGEGDPPSDQDLRRLGIDPENNVTGKLDASEMFE